jgi:hypothetical protein
MIVGEEGAWAVSFGRLGRGDGEDGGRTRQLRSSFLGMRILIRGRGGVWDDDDREHEAQVYL